MGEEGIIFCANDLVTVTSPMRAVTETGGCDRRAEGAANAPTQPLGPDRTRCDEWYERDGKVHSTGGGGPPAHRQNPCDLTHPLENIQGVM